MSHIFSLPIENILRIGRDLKPFGSFNWALSSADALTAIEKLTELNVAILGGDVWKEEGERLTHTYDNWYCEPKSGEDQKDFVARSLRVAQDYIRSYKLAGSRRIYFEIVPKDLNTGGYGSS